MKKQEVEVLMYLTPTQLIVVLMCNLCFLLPCCTVVALFLGYTCGKSFLPVMGTSEQQQGGGPHFHVFF